MMTHGSDKVLRDALVMVRAALREKGNRANGATVYRKLNGGNVALVSLQKSQTSSASAATVAINYGVYSARVGCRMGDENAAGLDARNLHWRKRVSGTDGRERWFSVRANDSAADVASSLVAAIEGALVDLDRHATDEALRDEWLSGSSPGLTDMQRLFNLAILVSEIGPTERLVSVVSELRALVAGGAHEELVEHRLARIGIEVPR